MLSFEEIIKLSYQEAYELSVTYVEGLAELGYVVLREGALEEEAFYYPELKEGIIYKMYNVEEGGFSLFNSNSIDHPLPDIFLISEEVVLYFEAPEEDITESLLDYNNLVLEAEKLREEAFKGLEDSGIIAPPDAKLVDWNSSSLYC
jgi:hypothetical protein